MANFVSFVLLAVASIVLLKGCDGASTPDPSSFTFIGTYTHVGPLKNENTKFERAATQETSAYFLSQNAAGYSTADSDCKAVFGETGSLVYIETAEEFEDISKKLFSSDDSGSSYWIGGRYNPSTRTFIWDNKQAIGSWAPWDEGYPNSRFSITRVFISTINGLAFRTQFQTVSTRYICELQY